MKGTVAGITAVFTWATVFVVGRYAFLRFGVDPIHFVWIRYATAAPALWLLLAARGQLRQALKELTRPWGLLRYALLGATGCFGMSFFQALALPHVQATTLSLLMSTAPITTILFGFFIGEKPGLRGAAGVLLGMAGAGLIILSMSRVGRELAEPPWPYYGELMVLLAGSCWAAYTVLGKEPSRRVGGLVSTTLAVTAANIYFAAGIPTLAAAGLPPWPGMLAMLYVGIVPTAGGFALWYYALRQMDAGRLAILQYLNPAMAFLMALVLLEERLTWGAIVGLALVVVSVQISGRRSRSDTPSANGSARDVD